MAEFNGNVLAMEPLLRPSAEALRAIAAKSAAGQGAADDCLVLDGAGVRVTTKAGVVLAAPVLAATT
mgnify:CR=1 FL=1